MCFPHNFFTFYGYLCKHPKFGYNLHRLPLNRMVHLQRFMEHFSPTVSLLLLENRLYIDQAGMHFRLDQKHDVDSI